MTSSAVSFSFFSTKKKKIRGAFSSVTSSQKRRREETLNTEQLGRAERECVSEHVLYKVVPADPSRQRNSSVGLVLSGLNCVWGRSGPPPTTPHSPFSSLFFFYMSIYAHAYVIYLCLVETLPDLVQYQTLLHMVTPLSLPLACLEQSEALKVSWVELS